MLKLERTCDRCGAVIEKIDYKNKLENILTPTISFFDGKEDTNYDICDSCACQFLDWMKNAATIEEHLKKTLEKHEKLSRWSDKALAMARGIMNLANTILVFLKGRSSHHLSLKLINQR